MPFRIRHHCLPPDLVKRDILRRMLCRRRNRHRRKYPLRVTRRPLQHLHPAHRATRHTKQRLDPEMIHQTRLRSHHIPDGHNRKFKPARFTAFAIARRRAGCAEARSQHIRTNHKKTVRIIGLARPDHGFPPARTPRHRVHIRDMLIACQRMTQQNRVRPVGIQRSISLVSDPPRRKHHPAVKLKSLRCIKPQNLARRLVRLVAHWR